MLEIVAHGRFPQGIDVWLRDGTVVTCPDYKDLAKRLKFSVVQKMRIGDGGMRDADIQGLSALLPVKSAWKNATLEVSLSCFESDAPLEFCFTRLLMCKEVILDEEQGWNSWSPAWMRLPAIAECNRLNIPKIAGLLLLSADAVEWLEHEAPPERKWCEPRQLILGQDFDFHGGIDGLLTALKTAFSASSSPKPYVLRVLRSYHRVNLDEELENETTHEQLTIRARQNDEVSVERA